LTHNIRPVTEAIDVKSEDEFGKMSLVFNEMLGSIHEAMGSYNEAVSNLNTLIDDVRSRSVRVTDSSNDMEGGAMRSATAAGQIAWASEESWAALSESARATQAIAKDSEDLAKTAGKAAEATTLLQEAIERVLSGSDRQSKAASDAESVAEAG